MADGQQIDSGQGDLSLGNRSIRLLSRKTVSGSASFPLSGVSSALEQGSVNKHSARPMQGSVSQFGTGTVVATTGGVSPPVSPLTWVWDIPTLADERAFYDLIGWARTASDETFDSRWSPTGSGAGYSSGELHDISEADDLWTWDQQNKRYGSSLTNAWRTGWLNFYTNTYLTRLDEEGPGGADEGVAGFGFDHMHGQGLAVVYRDTSNPTALSVINSLRSRITGRSQYQTLLSGGTVAMSTWEPRAPARWLLVACYAAQATGDSAWVTVRNTLINGWLNSSDYQEGGIISSGGMYFAGRDQAGFTSNQGSATGYPQTIAGGQAAYDAGRRFNGTFQIGILAEALWRAYVQTGRTDIRARLVKMAEYVYTYAHRTGLNGATWNFPNVGSRFGHEGNGSGATSAVQPTGGYYHSDPADGTLTAAAKNCAYDLSLVGLMVMAYKLTTEYRFLDKARTFYKRGIRFNNGSPFNQLAPDGEVPSFLDTRCENGDARYFLYNKSALQYCYHLIENGGKPKPVANVPAWVSALAVGEWYPIPNTAMSGIAPSPTPPGITGPSSKVTTWTSFVVDTRTSKVYSVANGGHNDYGGNEVDELDLERAVPLWIKRLAPTPNAQISASTSYYSDGRPASRHTYYGVTLDIANDRIMLFGGAPWSGGTGNGFFHSAVSSYNIASNSYNGSGTHPSIPGAAEHHACTADPLTGDVYWTASNNMRKWTRSANTWTTLNPGGNTIDGFYTMSAMDTLRRRILFIGGDAGSTQNRFYTLSTNTFITATLNGANAANVASAEQTALCYVPELDRFLVRLSSAGNTVYQIHPTTLEVTTFSTTNNSGLTIPATTNSGIFNKFLYVPRLGGCICVPSYTGNAWFLRIY